MACATASKTVWNVEPILARSRFHPGGVDAGEHGVGSLENFVVQADTNRRQFLATVDYAGLSRGCLVHIVNSTLADGHAQQVAHQFQTPR
jgi:hypothetical protein